MGSARPFILILLCFALPAQSSASEQNLSQIDARADLSGTVVDESGSALPQVAVHLLDSSDAIIAVTFTDSRGTFRFAGSCNGCFVTVTLPGFGDARVAIPAGTPVRVTLGVAAVRESLVVSATRTDAPSSQVGAALTVFTSDEIARRDMPTVAELLRAAPGATVVRSGGLGNVTSLFVRGGESSYNKVLLDGIPLNEPGGTFNFSNLTTDFVERVELVRGAQSALFGTDAMASVVQVVTKRAMPGRSRPSATVAGEFGSYDSQRGSASVGMSRGFWDAAIHAGRQQTDNREPNNRFANTTFAATGGVTATSNVSLRIVARNEKGRTAVPGATAFGRPDMDAFFRRRDGVIGATLNHQISDRWQQQATYALSVSHQQSTNLQADPSYVPRFGSRAAPFAFDDFPYDSLTDLRRHYVSYQADGRIAGPGATDQLLTLALDWNGERGVLTDRLAESVVRASRDNFGWTVQHQWRGTRASVSTGLRIEQNGSFGTTAAPRVSAAFMATPQTKLKANIGLGVKEPTIPQSFSPSPFFLGNADLEPERSRTIDAGIEQRLFDQHLKIEANWFDNRFRNIISTRTISFNPFQSQYFNLGETKARGAELAVEGAPSSSVRVRGGYTLVASRIVSSLAPTNPVFATGAWAFRRPRHSGFLDGVWTHSDITADLHGTFIGRRVDSDFSSLVPPIVENAGYAAWDAGLGYRLSMVTFYLRVENLTDREYMEPLGYPAWRRTARAGVRFAW